MRLLGVVTASLAILLAACGDKNKGEANYDQGSNDRAESLDKLLRGEISAVDSYNKAIDRYGSEPGGDDLRALRKDHEDAVTALRELVTKAGGKPSTSAAAWSNLTTSLTAGAKLFGNDAVFGVLETGEKHGVDEYEGALKDKHLTEDDKRIITDRLLPRQRTHIAKLTELRKRT